MSLSRSGRSGIAVSTSPKKARSLTDASGLPGPVQSLTATVTGSTTASASWSAPVISGDSAITSYTVTGGGSASVVGTTATITGLTGGTAYTFTVRGVNSVGSGIPASAPSITTTNFNEATGGTVTTVSNYNGTSETWRVHTFTSSGTFSVGYAPNTFRILLVGGGRAQASWGGGAGGVVDTTTSISVGNTTVSVGGGEGSTSVSGGVSSTAGGTSGGGSGSPQSIPGPQPSGTHPVSGRFIAGGGSGAGSAGLAFNYHFEPYAGRGGNPLLTNIRGSNEHVSSGGSGVGCSSPEDTPTIAGSGGGGRAQQGGIAVFSYRIA